MENLDFLLNSLMSSMTESQMSVYNEIDAEISGMTDGISHLISNEIEILRNDTEMSAYNNKILDLDLTKPQVVDSLIALIGKNNPTPQNPAYSEFKKIRIGDLITLLSSRHGNDVSIEISSSQVTYPPMDCYSPLYYDSPLSAGNIVQLYIGSKAINVQLSTFVSCDNMEFIPQDISVVSASWAERGIVDWYDYLTFNEHNENKRCITKMSYALLSSGGILFSDCAFTDGSRQPQISDLYVDDKTLNFPWNFKLSYNEVYYRYVYDGENFEFTEYPESHNKRKILKTARLIDVLSATEDNLIEFNGTILRRGKDVSELYNFVDDISDDEQWKMIKTTGSSGAELNSAGLVIYNQRLNDIILSGFIDAVKDPFENEYYITPDNYMNIMHINQGSTISSYTYYLLPQQSGSIGSIDQLSTLLNKEIYYYKLEEL